MTSIQDEPDPPLANGLNCPKYFDDGQPHEQELFQPAGELERGRRGSGLRGPYVDARRLDDEALADIDFIKVDVEGYEFQMLQGAAEAITRDRPVLLVEIEERHTKMTLVDAVGRIESSFVYRAYFYPHGCLAPFAALHPVANHSVSASRNDYVSNFIFFPEELPESDFNLGLRRLLGA